jgi:hypothetical protein
MRGFMLLAVGGVAMAAGISADSPAVGRQVLSLVVYTAENLCAVEGYGSGKCPVLLDVESFRQALIQVDSTTNADSVHQWFGMPIRDVPSAEAYACGPGAPSEDCALRHTGIHIRVDSLRSTGDTIQMDILITWHHSVARSIGFRSGMEKYRCVYERRNGEWHPSKYVLMAAT